MAAARAPYLSHYNNVEKNMEIWKLCSVVCLVQSVIKVGEIAKVTVMKLDKVAPSYIVLSTVSVLQRSKEMLRAAALSIEQFMKQERIENQDDLRESTNYNGTGGSCAKRREE